MKSQKIIAPEAKRRTMPQVDTFQQPEPDEPEPASHQRALLKAEKRKELTTIAEQVAQHTLCFRNYKYLGGTQAYPSELDSLQRFVTKCFPYAQGGMLLVDEVMNEREYRRATEKHAVLQKLGFRHIVIAIQDIPLAQGKVLATEFADCLEQLGE